MHARLARAPRSPPADAKVYPLGTEQEELSKGPLSVLMKSVKNNTQVLINLRNNHKLLGRVRAFDRHCNMVLEQVKEVWSEVPPGAKKSRAIPKDRVISKMFLRGAYGGGRARGAGRPRAQRGPRHGQGRARVGRTRFSPCPLTTHPPHAPSTLPFPFPTARRRLGDCGGVRREQGQVNWRPLHLTPISQS